MWKNYTMQSPKRRTIMHEKIPSLDVGWDHIALFDMQVVERVQTMVGPQEKAQQSHT